MPFGGTPVGFGAPAPAPAPAAPAPAFGAAPAAAASAPTGVSFQCEIKDGNGAAVNFFLHFGPEVATSVDAIGQLAGQLLQSGVPLKVWMPKQNSGFGQQRGGGFGNRGGFR